MPKASGKGGAKKPQAPKAAPKKTAKSKKK